MNTEGLVQRSPMKLNIPVNEKTSSQNAYAKNESAKLDTILRYGTLIILVLQTTATVSKQSIGSTVLTQDFAKKNYSKMF